MQPVKNGSHRERVLAVMAWAGASSRDASIPTAKIRELLGSSRVPKASKVNISDVLARAEELVAKDKDTGGWWLTVTGQRYVNGELGLSIGGTGSPPISPVRKVATSISDPIARGYVEEAILCLETGALRAAVVFLWTGAIRVLQEQAIQQGESCLTAAVRKHDSRAPKMTSIDAFARVKDMVTLLAIRDIGLIDKGEWTSLREGLDLRNRCSHPTKYRPGVAKVSAFIEDIVGILF